MSKYLGVVDADSILYRCAVTTENEPEGIAKYTLDKFIADNVIAPTGCQEYIFVFSGGESGRNEIAVTKPYKGKRTTERPKWLGMLKAYAMEQYKGLIIGEYEADDVVVAIFEQYKGDSLLCGIDKDAKQLSGAHYNYVKKEFFEISDTESQRFFFKQMLMGDTVDNIPGLPRIGEKKADTLFDENPDTPPARLVWNLYKEKGFDWEYYQEQFKLLRMQRDIAYPYEDHFIKFEEKVAEEEFKFD